MKYDLGRVFMVRDPQGVDLLEYLFVLAEKEVIRAGLISVIGCCNVGKGKYNEIKLEGFYELARGGNINLKRR